MRHARSRLAVFVLLLLAAVALSAFSTGPPSSRTGAFAVANKTAEPACNVCHGAGLAPAIPLNHPSGLLELLDLPTSYSPNTVYNLRLRLSHQWDTIPPLKRWGFQIQAVQANSGDAAGTWLLGSAPPDSFKIVNGGSFTVWKNRRYLEHVSASIHAGEDGPIEWHLRWQAPPGDSGKVYFFAAGNTANGDGLSIGSGDFIYTDVESLTAGGNVDVPRVLEPMRLRTHLGVPYPNPLVICTDLTFSVSKAGDVELAVFDAQGRKVRTLVSGWHEAGSYGSTWGGQLEGGRWARNGVYFIRLRAPGEQGTTTRKITLAH